MTALIKPLALAIVIFAVSMAASAGFSAAAPALVDAHPWWKQFVLKTTLAGLSLLAIRLLPKGGGLPAAGFRRANGRVRKLTVWLPALAMGALASILVLLAGSRGLDPVVGKFGFAGIVFWIWFYSSLTEEIFTRAWFLTHVDQLGGPAVAASAILFGAMHLSLIRLIDPIAVAVIVISATALGWIAGTLRLRYSSLWPAFAAHVFFNVGGVVGGIIYTLVYRITTGHLPVH